MNIVNIKRYLREHVGRDLNSDNSDLVADLVQDQQQQLEEEEDEGERQRETSPAKSVISERSYVSDMVGGDVGQRMYRTESGQSLPDMELLQQQAPQPQNRQVERTP